MKSAICFGIFKFFSPEIYIVVKNFRETKTGEITKLEENRPRHLHLDKYIKVLEDICGYNYRFTAIFYFNFTKKLGKMNCRLKRHL